MVDSERHVTRGRIAEIYSPCFSLILQLRASSHYSDAELLRSNLMQVLSECEQKAQQFASSKDVEDAKFAIVAFVDETILSSNWSLKGEWMSKPLQLQLYNRFDAGEHFFERMNDILQDTSSRLEVLEVYYLCLTLGFKGRYQLVEQDKLRARIESARAVLRQAPEMKAGVLSPNGLPRDQIAAEVKTKLPTWAIVATAVTIGLLIYLAMSIHVIGKADEVKSSIEELVLTLSWDGQAEQANHFSNPVHIDA